MSASEKLKALEKEASLNWPISSTLLDALPQIRAVVEAAEDAADHFVDQSAHDRGWPIELRATLAALDEALQ